MWKTLYIVINKHVCADWIIIDLCLDKDWIAVYVYEVYVFKNIVCIMITVLRMQWLFLTMLLDEFGSGRNNYKRSDQKGIMSLHKYKVYVGLSTS